MSSVRYRSHPYASPQITQRILQHDLEVVGEAMTAFDGFSSAGPVLEPMVLQRPTTFAAQLPSAVVDTGLKSIWNGSILALMAFKNSND